ncbi:MAG: serine/threonine-protein phosphatase [Deltaproteobacteria bacterium]|nr:serine/threonine-protein phosphatase [Deltaproteobacteria bacterium]
MKLISWALTNVGRKRDHNEDNFIVDDDLSLFAVADGMGGHQGGDQASKMAISILRREVGAAGDLDTWQARVGPDEDTLRHVMHASTLDTQASMALVEAAERAPLAVYSPRPSDRTMLPAAMVIRAAARMASRAIFDAAQAEPRFSGMGTTLTALLFHKERAHLAHVGDSRAFLYRNGTIEQITEDHSWINEQIKAGVMSELEAKESKFRHVITRSVGFEREVDVDLFALPALPGDCFLLCSDGMTNYVETAELGRVLATTYYRKVPQLLVDIANDRGGDDNITVVLVYAANDH